MKSIKGVPGYSLKQAEQMTPGRRMYLRRIAAKVCVHCAKAPISSQSKSLCEGCLVAARERSREQTGAKRRYTKAKSYELESEAKPAGGRRRGPRQTKTPAVP